MSVRFGAWFVVATFFPLGAFAQAPCSDGASNAGSSPLASVSAAVTVPVGGWCKADPSSKDYPGPNGGQGVKSWWGRTTVQVRCKYECKSDNQPPVTVQGTRTVSFLGKEDGNELACYGIPYEQRYNNYRAAFVYVPMEPKGFNPKKSDVGELKDWVAGKLAPAPCGSNADRAATTSPAATTGTVETRAATGAGTPR